MKDNQIGLLSRIVNAPLLATPRIAQFYLGYLCNRSGYAGAVLDLATGETTPTSELTALGAYQSSRDASFDVVPGTGMAVIEVWGALEHKSGHIKPYSGATGYDGIERQLDDALADAQVKGILMDIHSHGGEVSGCFDLADKIRAANAIKPVWAVADEVAYSAAYCLASQASRLTMPRTGGVGSVGVVTMHVDASEMLKKEGFTVTLIHAGAHKVDGHPYAALPDDVRADVQAELDAMRRLFAEIVAAGNGITVDDVLATEARCLTADEAIAAGFADTVQPAADTFAEFAEFLAGESNTFSIPAASAASPKAKELTMAATRNGAASGAATQSTIAKANEDEDETLEEEEDETASAAEEDEDETVEDDEEEDTDAEDEDETDAEGDEEESAAASARASERKRIGAILNSPEAKGRESLAKHFATQTNLSAKAARAALKAAPQSKGGLAQAMAGVDQPKLGPGGDSGPSDDVNALVSSIRSAGAKARGVTLQ